MLLAHRAATFKFMSVCISMMLLLCVNNDLHAQDTIRPIILEGGKIGLEAHFPGGDKGWAEFMTDHLDPTVPINHKAPSGIYTVRVKFTVDKTGTLTEITIQTNNGFGMEEEVTRVLALSPKWVPATIDGEPVRAYRVMPVTFQVEGKSGQRKKWRDEQ